MIQDTGYKMQDKKVIMIMTKDSVFTKRGNTVSRLPLTAQMNTENNELWLNMDFLKNGENIKILKQEGNVAVLEIIPKETEEIKIFDKAEITVDTEKGVITSQKLFTPMGVVKTEMEYEKLEVGSEKLEVLKEMKTITQYGVTTMRYKNVKINKGISKKKFKL
jgi:outer membrane lipoprotein-sorting protein